MNRSRDEHVGPVKGERSEATISEHGGRTWAWLRLGVGALVLGVLVVRIGAGPFVDGVRLTSASSLLAATAITAITTMCCAWRWRLVAARLRVPMTLPAAVLAVYRAQLLNATLPGGVLGDVDRAVGHGRDSGALGRSVRSVVWERALGQVAQVGVTIVILVVVPSPLRTIGVVALAVALAAVALAFLVTVAPTPGGIAGQAVRAVEADLRTILDSARDRTGVAVVSTVAVTGHLLVFLLAAHVAGVHTATYRMLPLAAVVLLGAAVPVNVAGWGPREGVAAWAFGAAGLGAATGVTTAVVYGVMALVATLPGALVLLAGRRAAPPARVRPRRLQEAVHG